MSRLKHLILGIFALVLVLSSLFLQSRANNKEELSRVRYGLPFSFITQDHTAGYSFSYFPTWDKFDFKNPGTIKNFYLPKFLASFLSVFLILEIIVYLLETADFWVRRKFFKEEKDEENRDEKS